MKSSFLKTAPLLSGALTLGALALAGCGGGGTSPQTPQPTATPNPNATPSPTATPTPAQLSQLVFVSTRDGNNEIYSARSDGTQQIRLTNNGAADNSPARSRDGSRVVFSSNRAGNFEIYSMGIAGESANLQRFTTDTDISQPIDTAPVFSADGSKIAWISTRGGSANVWIMDSTGANQSQVTTEGSISSVAFSPDGTEIAFSVARTANAIIVARNLSSNAERTLVSGAFSALSPRYNPAGTQLVFTQSGQGGADQLRILTLAGGAISDGPQGATTAQGLRGAFSPDGTRLAFETSGAPSPQIGVSGLNGGVITSLTGQGSNFAPSWGQ